MGLLLALVIWLIAIVTVGLFAFSPPQWWFPPAISEHGAAIDRQFGLTFVVVGISFFLAQAAVGDAVWRYRARGNERATYSHGNTRLELIWTGITAMIFVTLAFM